MQTIGVRRAMRPAFMCAIWLAFVSIPMGVFGGQSTLKVAVCKPGQAPYAITQRNGSLAGFDVGGYNNSKFESKLM